MKQTLALILSAAFIFGCKGESAQKPSTQELRTYFTSSLRKIDSTIIVDSFRFLRIDTLTERDRYVRVFSDINESLRKKTSMMEAQLEVYKSNMKMARLAAGLSSALYTNAKNDADDAKAKIDQLRAESLALMVKFDSSKARMARADSVRPAGYLALCLFQIRGSDMSVNKDTCRIILNPDKNIVEPKAFYGDLISQD